MPSRPPPTVAFEFPSSNGNTVLPTSSAARAPSPPKSGEYWQPRATPHHTHSHTRTTSQVLGKMRYGRGRSGSVAQAAGEIADSLKAPLSPKLIVLCLIWYLSSALSNTSSKSILNSFPQPVTLTVIQFAFVSSWCILLSICAKFTMLRSVPGLAAGLRFPTRVVIATTAPLAIFQVGGHIASSIATQKIPVSLVHTIKGMSPLFTVFAYRLLFKISYSRATYISLLPLTVGVMLACSVEFHGNLWGITCAFLGAIIFVSQNIFSKKLFNESSSTGADPSVPLHKRKLDKLNLLCYSSGMAFLLTLPLWFYSEGFQLLQIYTHEGKITLLDRVGKHGEEPLAGHELVMQFVFNGTVHFGQNIIAFVLLSLVSPVTYSVASLIKRIFVIVMAIVWFGNRTTTVQAVGISLTFFGLYLYDRAGDVARGERRVLVKQTKALDPLLPVTARSGKESPLPGRSPHPNGVNGYAVGLGEKVGNGQIAGNSAWLAPRARQEDTWRPRETAVGA